MGHPFGGAPVLFQGQKMLIPDVQEALAFFQAIEGFLRYIGYKNVIMVMAVIAIATRAYGKAKEAE